MSAQKLAIVTGVSKGIGLATVQALIESGVRVIGWGRNAPSYEHVDFEFVSVDITDLKQVKEAYQQLEKEHGTPHYLINNAGLGYFKLFEVQSPEEWQEMFNVNVHGIYNVCHMVVPAMKTAGRGHIINLVSIAGLEGIPEATGYCATKFAVRGFSESLYKEVRKSGVKVSCIYPGSVNTEFFDNYPGVTANETMLAPTDIANTILNVLQTPDNVLTLNVEIKPLNPRYK